MENVKQVKSQHNHLVHIDNRERIEITGVTRVETFNEDEVVLHTVMGVLNLKGKNMKVNKLNVDTGDMLIEGMINSMHYLSKDKENKGNIIKKLFK